MLEHSQMNFNYNVQVVWCFFFKKSQCSQIILKTLTNKTKQSRYFNAKEYWKSNYKTHTILQSWKDFLWKTIWAERKSSWNNFFFPLRYGKSENVEAYGSKCKSP